VQKKRGANPAFLLAGLALFFFFFFFWLADEMPRS
jgi:hypothetical protein